MRKDREDVGLPPRIFCVNIVKLGLCSALMGLAGGLGSCSLFVSSSSLGGGRDGSFYYRLAEKISDLTARSVDVRLTPETSLGSLQNLERLQQKKVDFALTQLDVAVPAMRQRQIQAIAVLGHEQIHLITLKKSGIQTFEQLANKRIAIGPIGSGTHQTAQMIFAAAKLPFQADTSALEVVLQKLNHGDVDALLYIGSVGASFRLRAWFEDQPESQLIPLPQSLINYLTIRDPDAYQGAILRQGSYNANPPIPPTDVATLSTPTVLITRPDVNSQLVGLITWALVDGAREFALFYPELQTGEPEQLLKQGLFYLHPGAQEVYRFGDPRSAWARYWENNNDLQAGVMILVVSTVAGLGLRYFRHQRSLKLMTTTSQRITELRQLLPDQPDQALAGVEELNQEHRLLFIDGKIAAESFDQVQNKTQRFAEQCQILIQDKRNQAILHTLLLVDEWQATLQTTPEEALDKLKTLRRQYRQMLLDHQVNIQDYIELMELTLMSLTTFAPSYVSQFVQSRSPVSSPMPPQAPLDPTQAPEA